MSKTKILLTGVTGYIGGSVLTRLSQRPDFKSAFDIRCLVRSSDKTELIQVLFDNITNTPVGSHDDMEFMTQIVSEVDVVIAMADAEDIVPVIATLQGLKKRYEATGKNKKTIFIQTSGAEVLSDYAAGMHKSDTIWDDTNEVQMDSFKPTLPHRLDIEKRILDADIEGYVNTYMIFPSNVWGIAKGDPLKGDLFKYISNKQSIQIPTLIRACLPKEYGGLGQREYGGMIGKGLNMWANVEIQDYAELYNLLLDAALSSTANPGHGKDGYYFGAYDEKKPEDENNMKDIGQAISDAMFNKNIGKKGEPTPFTTAEIENLEKISKNRVYCLGSNARCVANRATKTLNWKPTKNTKHMLASVKDELDLILSKPHA